MKKTYLVELSGRHLLFHDDEEIILTSYWSVDKEWVYDHLRWGGQDSPVKGPISRRIYIGDREFEYICAGSHVAHQAYREGGAKAVINLKNYQR